MAYENEGLPDYNEATGEFGDRVHDRSLNDGEGGDRYAFPHESVRAIVQQRKAEIAARNDPVERWRVPNLGSQISNFKLRMSDFEMLRRVCGRAWLCTAPWG